MKTAAHLPVSLAGAHGPALKLTSRRGPDLQNSRAGFGSTGRTLRTPELQIMHSILDYSAHYLDPCLNLNEQLCGRDER